MTAVCKTWNLPAVSFKPLCNNLYQPTGDNTSCPACVTPAVPPGDCIITKTEPFPLTCSGAIPGTRPCACQTLYGDYGDYGDGNPGFVGTFVDTYTKIWKLTVTTTPVFPPGSPGCSFAGTYYLYESQPGIGRCIGEWETKQRYQVFNPYTGACEEAGFAYPLWHFRWIEGDVGYTSFFELRSYGKAWTTGALSIDYYHFGTFNSLKNKVCKGATYFPWRHRSSNGHYTPRSRFVQFYDMTIEGL